MSEVNIDARLIRDGGSQLSRIDEKPVEMSNGCICCTRREDLPIESTGISKPLSRAASGKFNRTVFVAMIAVWVMQVAVDQIVDMIAVRYRLVSASGPMNVIRGMGATIMVRRTAIRIFRADLDAMFVDVFAMWMMQMPIM